jgi:hypothetical protein
MTGATESQWERNVFPSIKGSERRISADNLLALEPIHLFMYCETNESNSLRLLQVVTC